MFERPLAGEEVFPEGVFPGASTSILYATPPPLPREGGPRATLLGFPPASPPTVAAFCRTDTSGWRLRSPPSRPPLEMRSSLLCKKGSGRGVSWQQRQLKDKLYLP